MSLIITAEEGLRKKLEKQIPRGLKPARLEKQIPRGLKPARNDKTLRAECRMLDTDSWMQTLRAECR